MQLLVTETENWTMLTIEKQEGEILTPVLLENLVTPVIEGSAGLILNGAAPVWLHGYLVAKYKNTCKWVAINDPKLKGAVVIGSHDPSVVVGSIQSTALIV